jgi:heme exporter protein A
MLNVNHLSCQKGYHLLFQNLSFKVAPGEVVRITGTNGCGKTSLLKIIAGLSSAESGYIKLNHQMVKSSQYQQNVLYLGHTSTLSPELTSLENLEFLNTLNYSKNSNLPHSLAQLDLKNYTNEPCAQFSAGQKRRVILASLLSSKAQCWLLDEPFTALDTNGVGVIEAQINRHTQQGGICLFTTHQNTALTHREINL